MGENEPLTSLKVEQGIRHAMNSLAQLVHDYAEAGDAAAVSEAEFKLAWATARTEYRADAAAGGWKTTEAVVDDHATISTYEALSKRIITAQKAESLKLAMRAMQARLDAMRSLGAGLRGAIDG